MAWPIHPASTWLFVTLSIGLISLHQINVIDARRVARQVSQIHMAPHTGPGPSPSELPPSGINYRALGTNHYRNFYRNRNYFVRTDSNKVEQNTIVPTIKDQSSQKPISLQQNGDINFASHNKTNETGLTQPLNEFIHTENKGRGDGEDDYASLNDPIVFEDVDATPYSAYVRPLQPIDIDTGHTGPSSISNNDPKTKKSEEVSSPTVKKFEPVPDGKTPPCAQNAVYCESFDNYPRKLLNEVLERSITPEEFQQAYGETTDNTSTTTGIKSVLQRTGLNPGAPEEETPLCSAVEHTIYPKIARNKENKWLYVVNHDEYIQGVRIEKCLEEGQSCFYGDTGPAGYQTACRQKYIYKKLLALTPDGKTSSESFKLPSCCSCFVKTASIADRLGPIGSGPSGQISKPATRIPASYAYNYETETQDDIENTTEILITTQSMEISSQS